MPVIPASYLQVKAHFLLHAQTFQAIADDLGTSSQYVGYVLRHFWQRTDRPAPRGKLAKQILARTEEMLRTHMGNGSALDQKSHEIDEMC
jgi:hypothetical protein